MTQIGIVVPVYKEEITEYEEFSLRQLKKVLGHYPLIFAAPTQLKGNIYREMFPSASWQYFSVENFDGFTAYNQLLMSDEFYAAFSEYEKILICQTDVLVLADRLQDFLALPYDYIGAPIAIFQQDLYQLYGGNGGFSLRDVKACREVIQREAEMVAAWRDNEDEFFSHVGLKCPEWFRVAPVEVAARFSFDRFSKFLYQFAGEELPMALHAWFNHDLHWLQNLIKETMAGCEPLPKKWGSTELAELQSFLLKNQLILFYGAGQWGKCFLQYCQYRGIAVAGFVVSDNQCLSETMYRGVPIWKISDVPRGIENYGVVLTTGRMYRPEIKANLQLYGVRKMAELSEVICDEVGTFLLADENKRGKAVYIAD